MDNQEITPDMLKQLLTDPKFQQVTKSFLGTTSKPKVVDEALNVRDVDSESVKPKLSEKSKVPDFVKNKRSKPDEDSSSTQLSIIRTSADPSPSTVMDTVIPFMDLALDYSGKRNISTYIPSSLMMFELIHHINDVLVDNRQFLRTCPDYHPYLLRVYCGVLFWIQCLRVGAHADILNDSQQEFLAEFLDSHPLESLHIPCPLIPIFKTLCASQPEFKEFGHLLPIIPEQAGPTTRSDFILDRPESFALPNVPGILALIAHLSGIVLQDQPAYPPKSRHNALPLHDNPNTFGSHQFPIHDERSDLEKWSLNTPGLEWPCEATKKVNESFAERIDSFAFPVLAATDDLSEIKAFLNMNRSNNWFFKTKDVVERISIFLKNSGTLADCPVFGNNANQYLIHYIDTVEELAPPTKIADRNSMFPLSYYASTSVSRRQNEGNPSLSTACLAQTNVVMPQNHPYFANFGAIGVTRLGDFWQINPINTSGIDHDGHARLRSNVLNLTGSDK